MALSEAALYQVILLTAASHFATLRGTTEYGSQLLQMRQDAIRHVNDLLLDPLRSLSDQAIAAVAKMASCTNVLLFPRPSFYMC